MALDWASPCRNELVRRRVIQLVRWWIDPAHRLDPAIAEDDVIMTRLGHLIAAWEADSACGEEWAQLQAVYADVADRRAERRMKTTKPVTSPGVVDIYRCVAKEVKPLVTSLGGNR